MPAFSRGRLLVMAAVLALVLPHRLLAQTAIITHRDSKAAGLSAADLKRVLLGETQTLGGAPVTIIECAPLRSRFYQQALGLADAEVKRRWVALAFRGEARTLPRELPTAEEVRRYVAEHQGTIAFVDASAVDGSVKVLAIDGARPGDAGYRFK